MAGLWDYLETKPEAGYAAWLNPQRNAPATFWDSMQRQYQNYYSKYLGELGQQIMRGQDPTLRWMDYLQNQNPMSAFRGLSGYNQGQRTESPLFRFLGGWG